MYKAIVYAEDVGRTNELARNIRKLGISPVRLHMSRNTNSEQFRYKALSRVNLFYARLNFYKATPNMAWGAFGITDNIRALSVRRLLLEEPDCTGLTVILEGAAGGLTNFPEVFMRLGAKEVISSAYPIKGSALTEFTSRATCLAAARGAKLGVPARSILKNTRYQVARQ